FLDSEMSSSERISNSKFRLARKATTTAQAVQHQERRGQTFIARRVVVVRPVRDVEDVQEDLDCPFPTQFAPPPSAKIELEVVGPDGAVPAASVFHAGHHGDARYRRAVDAGWRWIGQLAVLIDVDIAIEDRERRATHVPHRGRERGTTGMRNFRVSVE